MSWIADAHREWHYAHGSPEKTVGLCPLDCYDPPDDYDPEWEDAELPLTVEDEEILAVLYA